MATATAEPADVKLYIKTDLTDPQIQNLLDRHAYVFVNTWKGGVSISSDVILVLESIVAAWIINHRNPSTVWLPGGKLEFRNLEELKKWAIMTLNSARGVDAKMRFPSTLTDNEIYTLRVTGGMHKIRNPPF